MVSQTQQLKCTLRCSHCERDGRDSGLGVKRINFSCSAASGTPLGHAVYYFDKLVLERSESPEAKNCLAEGSRNENRNGEKGTS